MDWQKEDTVAPLRNKRASLVSLQRQAGHIIAELPGISLDTFWPGRQTCCSEAFSAAKTYVKTYVNL